MHRNTVLFQKIAAVLLVLAMVFSFAACGTDSSSGESSTSDTGESQVLSDHAEDPDLQGSGTVSLLEAVGSAQAGFAFRDAAWFTTRTEYIKALGEIWPEVASGEVTAEYEDSASGVYLTSGMAQFRDFNTPAVFRITETGGEVTACAFVFRFDKDRRDDYLAAFLQAREMMTETFGSPDEDIAPFDSELPGGATWYGEDRSGLGITDTSVSGENYQFEITLSAPAAQG